MKPIRCILGRHVWRLSIFQPLNILPGEHSVICDRCGKGATKTSGRVLPARRLGKGRV